MELGNVHVDFAIEVGCYFVLRCEVVLPECERKRICGRIMRIVSRVEVVMEVVIEMVCARSL